jgi:hypothetical protein
MYRHWMARYDKCLLRPYGTSQGDFGPPETHRNPSSDKLQHEPAGVTAIIRHVIGKLDSTSSLFRHDPHFQGWRVFRKAVPVDCQPVSFGEIEKHCRIATCGDDPPGRGIRPEPMLFKIRLPHHTLHAVLSIQDEVCRAVGIEHCRRGSQMLEPAPGFLATPAIAGAGQNRPTGCLQFYPAASAYRGEVFVLRLLHCDRHR